MDHQLWFKTFVNFIVSFLFVGPFVYNSKRGSPFKDKCLKTIYFWFHQKKLNNCIYSWETVIFCHSQSYLLFNEIDPVLISKILNFLSLSTYLEYKDHQLRILLSIFISDLQIYHKNLTIGINRKWYSWLSDKIVSWMGNLSPAYQLHFTS